MDHTKEIERAFGVLRVYGVPEERAGTVSNGISVLMTRIGRERSARDAELSSLRSALAEKTAQVERLREALEDVSSQIHFLKMGICAGDSSKELEIRCVDIRKLAREALAATAPSAPEAST